MTKRILDSKCFYIDTFAQHSAHEMFNTSLILMCSKIFDSVVCQISMSSYSAYKNLLNKILPSNIRFKKVFVIGGTGKLALLFRYLLGAFQNVIYFILAPKESIIVFPFNNLFSLRIINMLNKIFKKKIIIFCHGEMEGITYDVSKSGFLHKILAKLSKNFFLNKNLIISEGIYFSVMGNSVKNNLEGVVGKEKIAKFICVDHSYIFTGNNISNDDAFNEVLQIGTVGTLNKIKGLDSFINFIREMNPLIKKNVRFSVNGRVSSDLVVLNELNVDTIPNNEDLARDEFNNRIKKLDYILFFYPLGSYRITASGAIMDAIFYEKPILALKNDYFNYVFEKFGSFGYLFDTIEQMHCKLEEILENRTYASIDFKAFKTKFEPEAISGQLRQELLRVGYLNQI